MADLDLEPIRARAEAATAQATTIAYGKAESADVPYCAFCGHGASPPGVVMPEMPPPAWVGPVHAGCFDAIFAKASAADVPALLAEVERLRRLVAAERAYRTAVRDEEVAGRRYEDRNTSKNRAAWHVAVARANEARAALVAAGGEP